MRFGVSLPTSKEGLSLPNPFCDLGLPSCLGIRIWGLIEAIQQGAGDGSSCLSREFESVFKDSEFGSFHGCSF